MIAATSYRRSGAALYGLGVTGYTCSADGTICAPTTQTALFKQLQTLSNALRTALGVDFWAPLTIDGSIGPATSQLVQTIADNEPITTPFLSRYGSNTSDTLAASDIAANADTIVAELQAIATSVGVGASAPKPAPKPASVPGGTAPTQAPSPPAPGAAAAALDHGWIDFGYSASANNAIAAVGALTILGLAYKLLQKPPTMAPAAALAGRRRRRR